MPHDVRGGGDPRQAWFARRLREWACRPRSSAADAHDCIMVWIRMDPPNTRVWRDLPRLMASSPRIITRSLGHAAAQPARTAGGYVDDRRRRPAPLSPLPEQAHMTRAGSRGRITGTSKRLQLLRYPRSKPICATRPVSEHDQPHMRSPLISSCTKIPLSAGRAQEDENHSRKRHFRPWLATVRLPGSARTDQVLGDDGIMFGVFVRQPSS